MTDQHNLAPHNSAERFGPADEDVVAYKSLLQELRAGNSIEFNPRTNAELTSLRIDRRNDEELPLGTFTNSDVDTVGLDKDTQYKIAQQRYIAGILGLKVGPLDLRTSSHTVGSGVDIPDTTDIPTITKDAAGAFVDEKGEVMSQVRVDAIYSAHFIITNRDRFEQPKAFEELFRRVSDQAASGKIEVKDKVGDVKGAMSLVRQTARALGYEVGDFHRTSSDTFEMDTKGRISGFDTISYFK